MMFSYATLQANAPAALAGVTAQQWRALVIAVWRYAEGMTPAQALAYLDALIANAPIDGGAARTVLQTVRNSLVNDAAYRSAAMQVGTWIRNHRPVP